MRKTIGIILLLVYMAVLLCFAAGEYCFQTGKPTIAVRLNPFVSEYHMAVFNSTQPKDQASIKKAIALEPLNPLYHMVYGLELLRDYSKRTRASDQIAFHEIEKAYQLKPYSKTYKNYYEQYVKPYIQ